MTATFLKITRYLDFQGWINEIDEVKSHVVTRVKAENVEQFMIVISSILKYYLVCTKPSLSFDTSVKGGYCLLAA